MALGAPFRNPANLNLRGLQGPRPPPSKFSPAERLLGAALVGIGSHYHWLPLVSKRLEVGCRLKQGDKATFRRTLTLHLRVLGPHRGILHRGRHTHLLDAVSLSTL